MKQREAKQTKLNATLRSKLQLSRDFPGEAMICLKSTHITAWEPNCYKSMLFRYASYP